MNRIKFAFWFNIVSWLVATSTSPVLLSCSQPPEEIHDVRMFVLTKEMTRMLISKTGTISIDNINEFVYKKTADYELVGVTAEMNRNPDTKGESIMHVRVAFIRFKNSSKIEMYDIVQPLYMLQQQEWKETLEQLKTFE